MLNPRLAGRYAKSLIDLAEEKDQLDAVYADIIYLQSLCKASNEFLSLLKSPVIPGHLKAKAFTAVTSGNIGELTAAFKNLLISKNRETFIPEIIQAFIEQYNVIKGINKVKLTTATEVSQQVKDAIITKVKNETAMKNIALETVVNEDLIGGFVLEFNNNLIDASILRDLKDVRKQFDENTYLLKIR